MTERAHSSQRRSAADLWGFSTKKLGSRVTYKPPLVHYSPAGHVLTDETHFLH